MAKALEFTSLDFNDPKDTLIALSFSSVDYAEPEKRKGTWSKTITMPATKTNDRFFGLAFNVNNTGDFDRKIKTPIIIESIGFTGTIQLIGVKSRNNKTQSYSVKIFGDLSGWVQAIGSKRISELEYLETHTFTEDLLFDSWSNTAEDSTYIYAPINYGGFIPFSIGTSTQTSFEVDIENFRPSVFTLPMITQIYKEAGYRFIPDKFNETKFKNAVIPFTNSSINTVNEDLGAEVSRSGDHQVLGNYATIPLNPGGILIDRDVLILFNDVISDSTDSLFGGAYVAKKEGTYRVSTSITINYHPVLLVPFASGEIVADVKDSDGNSISSQYISSYSIIPQQVVSNSPTPAVTYNHIVTADIELSVGDKLSLRHLTTQMGHANLTAGSVIIEAVDVKTMIGSDIDLKKTVPDLKQIDLLVSFIKKGNFRTVTDDNARTVEWIQDEDFLTSIPEDWNGKIDKSRTEEIVNPVPTSKLIWRYKNDLNDSFIKKRDLVYKKGYASVEFLTDNEFGRGERVMASSIFSSTEMMSCSLGSLPVMSTQGTGTSLKNLGQGLFLYKGGEFETAFEPRILIHGGDVVFDIKVKTTTQVFSKTSYPYLYFVDIAGRDDSFSLHFDNVNFPDTDQQTFTRRNGTQGLVAKFHESTVNRIQDGKILSVWLRLDELDIVNLDFRTPKILNNNQYYLSKVTDYLVGTNESTPVELISR